MSTRHFVVAVTCLITFYIADVAYALKTQAPDITELQVSNPYSMDVEMEVKCDWDHTKQKFKFQKKFQFPSKSVTWVTIPRGSYRCQLWPRVNFF
jgi:hypothetical protein